MLYYVFNLKYNVSFSCILAKFTIVNLKAYGAHWSIRLSHAFINIFTFSFFTFYIIDISRILLLISAH